MRLAAMLLCLFLLMSTHSAFAIRINAELPGDLPRQRVVQPGESTTFAIDFTNLENSAGVGVAWIRHFLPGFGTDWLIEPLQPDICLYPIPAEGLRIDFGVELQGNETRRCVYRLTRAASTFRDGYLSICPGEQPMWFCSVRDTLVVGTLPDIGVQVTLIPPATSAVSDFTYRIDVTNASAVPTRELPLYNECREPVGENPANLPFRLEVGFTGACPAATVRSCSPEPPATLFGWQVSVPSIPANGSVSCLVRVRISEPFDDPINDRFSIWWLFPFDPGHPIPLLHPGAEPNQRQGYDMNRADDLARFTINPLAVNAAPVPLDNLWLWSTLAALLATCGWCCHRQRGTRIAKVKERNGSTNP